MNVLALALLAAAALAPAPADTVTIDGRPHALYPATATRCPLVDSPLTLDDGRELVVIRLWDGSYGLADVTIARHPDQVRPDAVDFPTFARTGLHDPAELAATRAITGRPLAVIDSLAAPGALSTEGFVAADETVLGVIAGDDALVRAMGLTHPDLARPLLHVWNLMQTDLDLDRWSMRHHQWRNVEAMKYHGHWVLLDAHDTKGGQRSPFADGLDGGFWIVMRRPLSADEERFLHERYAGNGPGGWDTMIGTLTRLWTGEMEAFYVTWYGFYEGHTDWRVDPLGIARIFGLRTVEQLEAAFPRRLVHVARDHHPPRR